MTFAASSPTGSGIDSASLPPVLWSLLVLTPDEITSHQFLVALRGYDRDEVHAFLTQIAGEFADLAARVQSLESDLEAATDPSQADRVAPVEPAPPPPPTPSALFAEIGQQTQRILEAAQQAGDELKRKARKDAKDDIASARTQAIQLIADGERRREGIEAVVAQLQEARVRLAAQLEGVGRSIGEALRDLAPEQPAPVDQQREPAAQEPVAGQQALPEVAEQRRDRLEDTDELSGEPIADPAPSDPAPARDASANGSGSEALEVRAAALSPLHPRMVRALKRGFGDLHRASLNRLRNAEGRGTVEEILPSENEASRLGEVAAEFLHEAYGSGLAAAAARSGASVQRADPAAAPGSEELAMEAGERVRSGLRSELEEGLAKSDSLAVMTDRITRVFEGMRGPGTDEMVANALIRAYESGVTDGLATAPQTRPVQAGPGPTR